MLPLLRRLMLIIMAIQTQQFPVAAVGRIVHVIVVSMMNRQFTKPLAREFAAAPPTNVWIDVERLLAIALVSKSVIALNFSKNPSLLIGT